MSSPQPSLQAWQQKLAQDLKGRGHDKLAWRTADGFALDALATRADLAGLEHLGALPLLQARRGWRIRELITVGAPASAAERAATALAAGADEVEFSLDELAQDAREPSPMPAGTSTDDPGDLLSSWSAPGDGGVAIHSRSDFDAALGDLDVARHPVWFSAAEGALAVLAWHLRRADARGVARDQLRGGFDVDPIARLTMRQVQMPDESRLVSQHSSVDSVFADTAAILRGCATECPGLRPVVVDGLVYHMTGAAPGFELGATLAALVESARRLADHGVDFATLARGCSVRMQIGHELVLEIAKLRALRLLWARVAQEHGAAGDLLIPQLLGITSSRQRAEEYDQRTNLLRTQIASFAAVLGGCDSIVTQPLDDGADDTDQAALARNQQLLLRHESHLGRVADPCAGSFTVERLTDRLARRGFEVLQEIEGQGGLLKSMQSGWFDEQLGGQEAAREELFRQRRRVLVGLSRFADLELGGPVPRAESVDDDAAAAERIDAHRQHTASRDAAEVQAYLAALGGARDDLVALATGDRADHATLAEIATARWPNAESTFEHRFLPLAVCDAHEFEELRLWAQIHATEGGPLPRVALLPLGPVRMARARADFARDLFLVGGLPVDDPGLLDGGAAALAHVRDTGAKVAVLCSDDESYPGLVDELDEGLRTAGCQLVVAGRIDDALASRVDGSVHVGMDVVAFLEQLQTDLGLMSEDADDHAH